MLEYVRPLTSPSLLALSLGLFACQHELDPAATSPEAPAVVQGPIVNGQVETGYPAVGALTRWFGSQYAGSFCTGTLIAPDWILTAAHCLEDVTANRTRFYIGPDARPRANGSAPTNGTFYQAERLIIHPEYNARRLQHDIGLVKLASPVSGVTPYTFHETNLGPFRGQAAFFVGFGVDDGIRETGGGLKRSTSMNIAQIYTRTFLSQYGGSGTCFGDSGGPAFLTVSGVERVVGITSAGTACQGFNCDPCKTDSINVRTDAYAAWIRATMGAPAADCRDTPGLCACDAACQSNGACDNRLCQDGSCEETYECLVGCGSSQTCANECAERATPDGLSQLNALLGCLDQQCGSLSGQAFQQCANQQCAAQVQACFGGGGGTTTGDDSCDDVYGCMVACPASGGDACVQACFASGTADAQNELLNMVECFDDRCGNTSGDAFQSCALSQCAQQVEQCLGGGVGEPCDLTGGDCPAGEACWPTTSGSTACFPTAGIASGQSCNPATSGLQCQDGFACAGQSAAVCAAFCRNDAECDWGTCNLNATGIRGIGLCEARNLDCVDADNDGYCEDVDCDDNDPTVNPGAVEICDGKDNNCNGLTDEGCDDGNGPGDGGAVDGPGGTGGTEVEARRRAAHGCASGAGAAGFAWLAAGALWLLWRRRRAHGAA